MNNKTLTSLAQRRQRLVEQAATQRVALTRSIEPFHKPLAQIDQGLRIIHFVKKHPAFAISTTIVLGLLRRTRIGKWVQNGWAFSKVALNLRALLSK